MILAGHHRHGRLAIAEREDGDLFTIQALLDDDFRAGFAEFPVEHGHLDGFDGLRHVLGDGDAFARGESVRLDDQWLVTLLNIGAGVAGVVELPVFRRRDAVF